MKPNMGSINLTTWQDLMRLPWRVGAKQLSIDVLGPLVLLAASFLLAAINLVSTVLVGIVLTIILTYLYIVLPKYVPKTKFFFIYTIISFVILYLVLEYIVVPYLEILLDENLTLLILILCFAICVYYARKRSYQLQYSQICPNKIDFNRNLRCDVCQISVPHGDFHSYWFDCCVGQHNAFLLIAGQLFAASALIYGSNLTLTTVCHPFKFYKTILLPDDCSDAYQAFELGLAFVCAIYSIFVGVIFLVLLVLHMVLITLGVTYQEWRELSLIKKMFLLFVKRPYSIGIFGNWKRAISCSLQKYPDH